MYFLIFRLTAYERNRNFRHSALEIPDAIDVFWPVVGFQQLVQDHRIILPKLTHLQIEEYFLYRLAGDKQATSDVKALQKGGDMLAGNRILACSLLKKNGHIFLTGIVGAAMKNKVSYNYKISLEETSGDPVNSACECPAGKGPHGTCKHIASVLLMLGNFISNGTLQVQKTCTENLQSFHKPKSIYDGKPVPVEDMPTKRKFNEDLLEDPRPHKYRNNDGYPDFVRNMMVNHCAQHSQDMAMRFLHPSADIQAAALDHDYLPLPFTEYLVDKATKVTEEDALDLETRTKCQAKCKKWVEEREWRVTASRFGDITHATCRRNMEKLCESLLSSRVLHTKATEHGKNYKKKAVMKFENTMMLKVERAGLFVDPQHPYLGASPDGIIDENGILEIKCPYTGRTSPILPGKMFPFLQYDDNKHICLNMHSKYYDQIQGQMLLSKRKYCYFVVFTFVDMFVQKIAFDAEYCKFSLLPKLHLFYVKHFRSYIASHM
ncbi:uncharacterized protein LOC117320491 [Pecten maximus]|uniref:uncharacterized protein LOC117320491 n=1 Tax=Pecten maximus TaxID=6579 RepID=UPI0014584CE5|nr:uncharacterized protein LOC117320491 [Pecten maximus]